MEHIIIIVSIILVLAGSAWAWWCENGPERKNKGSEKQKDGENEEKQIKN